MFGHFGQNLAKKIFYVFFVQVKYIKKIYVFFVQSEFLFEMKLKHKFFVDIFINNDTTSDIGIFTNELYKLDIKTLSKSQEEIFSNKLRLLKLCFNQRWTDSNRHLNRFNTKHKKWLQNEFNFEFHKSKSHPSKKFETVQSSAGRPSKKYEDCSLLTKKLKISHHSNEGENNSELGLKSTILSGKRTGDKSLETILKEVMTNQKIVFQKLFRKDYGLVKMTSSEGLEFLINMKMTRDNYTTLRLESKNRGADIFPNYNFILEAKKEARPPGIVVTETLAQVSYQLLIDHTTSRIIMLQDQIICQNLEKKKSQFDALELIFNTGFDGSTGHSLYNQKNTDGSIPQDDGLIATVLIPIRLTSSNGDILWTNPAPHSVRFVRPVKLEFAKETKANILKMKNDIDEQIRLLEPKTVLLSNSKAVSIKPVVYQTAFDGKIRTVLTGLI